MRDRLSTEQPTIWGMKPRMVHDGFWAAQGVQAVYAGGPEASGNAEAFLLSEPQSLVCFELDDTTRKRLRKKETLRVLDVDHRGRYAERVAQDEAGLFQGFERIYDAGRTATVGVTRDRDLAEEWRQSSNGATPEVFADRVSDASRRRTRTWGRAYDARAPRDLARCVRDMVRAWKRPSVTVPNIEEIAPGVWGCAKSTPPESDQYVGPLWVGAGRALHAEATVAGPTVLWDRPDERPQPEITFPSKTVRDAIRVPADWCPPMSTRGKRVFDVAFSLTALGLTLPVYPLVMAAIWLEDGRPIFFSHRRETLGGRPFPCLKFRTMKRDAEHVKIDIANENEADGPQFFITEDPRLLRVGPFLRKSKIDELPQFLNVLMGQMSVVGPRPSPFSENQFCPSWREARLSVRPGITGLWQLKRTRQPGLDFQEWIQYDVEYVENSALTRDFGIIAKTAWKCLRDLFR